MSSPENKPIVFDAMPETKQDPTIDPKYQKNTKVRVDHSPIHGLGLFANIDLPAFTRVGTYEGEWTQEDGMHVLWVYDDEREQWMGIDGDNEMRFLNHSNEPNAEWSGIELFTLRWIHAGEEITFDYGWDDDEDVDDFVESREMLDTSSSGEFYAHNETD